MIDCDFIYNHGNAGGGVGLEEDCSAVISGCTFDENEAFNGGGICCASSSPQIIGCTFARNYGTNGGAIICADGSSPAISNCILAHSVSGGAVHCGMSDEPEITHCAAFGNAGGDSLCGTYHDNLFVDPLFCNMGQGDLALCANSQCLPGGNSWGELIGAREQGCDDCSSSPVKDESWGSIKAMYR